MSNREVIRAMLGRPVAFHSVLAKISGSASAGLMLSQAIYWSSRTQDGDGWFFKTQADWWEEICLSRYEQETARKRLTERGFLMEQRKGNPAKLFFLVKFEAISNALEQYVGTPQPSMRENHIQECGEPTGKSAGKQPTSSRETAKLLKETETTTETTSEITAGKSKAPAQQIQFYQNGNGKPKGLSQSERDTMDLKALRREMDKVESVWSDSGGRKMSDEDWAQFVRKCAYLSGLTPARAQELMHQFFPNDPGVAMICPNPELPFTGTAP